MTKTKTAFGWSKLAGFKHLNLGQKKFMLAWLFVAPVLIIRVLTTLYPMLTAFYYSFLEYDLIRQRREPGGLINFSNLRYNPAFWDSLSFTLIFTVSSVFFIIVLGTPLALLLKQNFAGRRLLRTVILIPWGLAAIVISIAGFWIFNDSYGIVNDMIRRIGFSDFSFAWLANPTGARVAVIIVNVWRNTPFFAIIMLAAFQGVPLELYESAKMDGANALIIFFRITMPYVMGTFILVTLFVGIWQINHFEIVYAMSRGGPGNATSLLAYRIYLEATRTLNFGTASAISVILFGVTAIYAVLGLSLYRRIDY